MKNLAQTTPLSGDDVKPAANAPNLIGKLVADDFLVQRRLGQGGMGQVYLAEQKSLNRKVALKILRPDIEGHKNARERFEIEARAVAAATHANIVQVHAFGEWEGLLYMALEYVEGWNLRDYLTGKGPPDVMLTLSILRQVGSALQRAGKLGITHRDIKPENILLTRKGEVKVADFGLSRDQQQPLNLTQSGVTMGTPLYMSPEQVEGKPVDPALDIYSLGVTTYHMLTGEPPFRGATAFEVALAHVRQEPVPLQEVRPDLPLELCELIHRMMEKNPDHRFQTARELLSAVSVIKSTIVAGSPTQPLESSSSSKKLKSRKARGEATQKIAPTRKPGSRSRSKWLLVIGSLLLAVTAGATASFFVNRDKRERGPVAEAKNRLTPEQRLQQKRKIAEEYLSGTDNFRNATVGSGVCVELGLIYLEQNRLPEAEEWFTKMSNAGGEKTTSPGAHRYQTLGTLGLAIVESMRDHPKVSWKLFREAFAKPRPKAGGPPRRNPLSARRLLDDFELRKWIAKAIKRNKVNDPEGAPLPPPLLNLLNNQIPR